MPPLAPDDFHDVYAHRAADYDRLVSHEDHAGNLLRALRGVVALEGKDVVEFGAGTGRVTRLLAPHVRSVRAFDRSPHMLSHARGRLRAAGRTNVALALADNARLPVRAECADLAVQGWSFGHGREWFPDRWQEEIGRALAEMFRVLRPGGHAVAFESLGTGRTDAAPPTADLGEYYRWLEEVHDFRRVVVRTDFRFESNAEAVELAGFFFGAELADELAASGAVELPECTGMWWRTRPQPGGPAGAAAYS